MSKHAARPTRSLRTHLRKVSSDIITEAKPRRDDQVAMVFERNKIIGAHLLRRYPNQMIT